MQPRANNPQLALTADEARLPRMVLRSPPTRDQPACPQESMTIPLIPTTSEEMPTSTLYAIIDPMDMRPLYVACSIGPAMPALAPPADRLTLDRDPIAVLRLPEITATTPAAAVDIAAIARQPNMGLARSSGLEVERRPQTARFPAVVVMAVVYPAARPVAAAAVRVDTISASFATDPQRVAAGQLAIFTPSIDRARDLLANNDIPLIALIGGAMAARLIVLDRNAVSRLANK